MAQETIKCPHCGNKVARSFNRLPAFCAYYKKSLLGLRLAKMSKMAQGLFGLCDRIVARAFHLPPVFCTDDGCFLLNLRATSRAGESQRRLLAILQYRRPEPPMPERWHDLLD